uniref:MIZ zinc finger domain-containing protein n=1 Tax=Coccidioides posadasii RMSCC 3488 TaxID=454284 RepID=A0A0J6IE29_COCPO|nr:MIZ zinc finger domain-containing protein [Coccidioides posadasii RMSCC 3488]
MSDQSLLRRSKVTRRPPGNCPTGSQSTDVSMSLANATASTFLGGHQRSWMQGPSATAPNHTSQTPLSPVISKSPKRSNDKGAEGTNSDLAQLLSPRSPPDGELLLPVPATEPQPPTYSSTQMPLRPEATAASHSSVVIVSRSPEYSGLPTPRDFQTAPSPAPPRNKPGTGATINDSLLESNVTNDKSANPRPDSTNLHRSTPNNDPHNFINCVPATATTQSPSLGHVSHGNKRMRTGETISSNATAPVQPAEFTQSGIRVPANQPPVHSQSVEDRPVFSVRAGPESHLITGYVDQGISRNIEFLKSKATPHERGRVETLQQACNTHDLFFLALHQILCLHLVSPDFLHGLPGFGPDQLAGLLSIKDDWFAQGRYFTPFLTLCCKFPRAFLELMHNSRAYMQSIESVFYCLPLLAKGWSAFVNTIVQRRYPPLIDELVSKFGVPSTLIQHSLFIKCCKLISSNRVTEWSRRVETIFRQDRAYYDARLANSLAGKPVPAQQAHKENEGIVREYQKASSLLEKPAGAGASETTNLTSISTTSTPANVHFQSAAPPTQAQFPQTSYQHRQTIPSTQPQTPQQAEMRIPQGQNLRYSYTVHPHNGVRFQHIPNAAFQQKRTIGPRQHSTRVAPGHTIPAQPQIQHPPSGSIRANPGVAVEQHLQHVPQIAPQHGHSNQCQCTISGIRQGSFRVGAQPALALQSLTVPQPANVTQYSHGLSSASPQFVLSSSPMPVAPNMPIVVQAPQRVPVTTHSRSFPNPPPVRPTPLLPPQGAITAELSNPHPYLVGLHQMHLRVNTRELVDNQSADPSKLLLTYVHSFALPPFRLGSRRINFSGNIKLTAEDFQRLPVRKSSPEQGSPVEFHTSGTRSYQLKCVRIKSAAEGVSGGEWASMDCCWPNAIYIHVNDTEHFVCRKFHNGKDLPVNISCSLRPGDNKIALTILRKPEECTSISYAAAIEVLETKERGSLRNAIEVLPKATALNRIIRKLQDAIANDDEVVIVDDYIAIDLVDPFMARIFEIPVRGKLCSHWECFDLDTFLATRPTGTGHSMAENWKCPICRKDARPQSLLIDEFLLDIRSQLVQKNQLDEVKAILVKLDGTWIPKTESDQQSPVTHKKETSIPGIAAPEFRNPQTSMKRTAPEIIEID